MITKWTVVPMYDYQKIAKALIRNADEIVTAIDRYIAKKDEDLKKTLKAEGYTNPDGTVDAINNLEETVAGILADQQQDLLNTLKEAEEAGDTGEQLKKRIDTMLENDSIQDDVGARVNGKLVTIDYKINNGDRIEIITSQNSKGPSRDWLNVVKSTQAKNKINQWFKNELKEDNILKGKELLSTYCKARGVNLANLQKQEYMDAIMRKYGFRDWDSVLAAMGHGALKEGQIVNKMQELYDRDHKKEMTNEEVLASIAENNAANAQNGAGKPVLMKSKSGIVVKGIADLSVRFSKCCSPVPGDEIVGYVTRGRGISIHRTDCINIINLPEMERARLIDAEWQPEEAHAEKYLAEIKIYANNRNGLLADISKALTEKNIDIMSMNTRTNRQGLATLQTTFEISGREELNRIIDKIRGIESVVDIERTTG